MSQYKNRIPLFVSLVCLILGGFFCLFFKGQKGPTGEERAQASKRSQTFTGKDGLVAADLLREKKGNGLEELPIPLVPEVTQLKRGANNRLLIEEAVVSAWEGNPESIFEEAILEPVEGGASGPLTFDPHTRSAIEASLDLAALESFLDSDDGVVRFPIAEGEEVLVSIAKVVRRGEHTTTLVGQVVDDSFSDVLIVFHDGAVHGTLSFHDTNRHFQLVMAGNGDVAIRELDPASFTAVCVKPDPSDGEVLSEEDLDDLLPEGFDVEGEVSFAPAGSQPFDMVVGYGREARVADGSAAAIEARILAGVDRLNQAFDNSEAGNWFASLLATMEDPDYVFSDLASSEPLSYELSNINQLSNGVLDALTDLRTSLGADQATFVVRQARGGASGVANRPGRHAVVARTSMSPTSHTFSHEVGHNLGLRHGWGDSGNSGNNPKNQNNYGWRFDPPNSGRVRTIMAYAAGGWATSRVLYFSNPDVSYNGVPTGAVRGFDATDTSANPLYDQHFVSDGFIGGLGSGFDGSNADLGAENGPYLAANSGLLANRAVRSSFGVLEPLANSSYGTGETLTVFWHGGDHTDMVDLALYQNGAFVSTLATGVTGQNRWYDLVVPSNSEGSGYTIRVTLNGGVFDESGVFSIGEAPAVAIDSPSEELVAIGSRIQMLNLEGTVASSDGSATSLWSQVSGPGIATFANASQADTTVVFSAAGRYRLRLTGTLGAISAFQEVNISVAEFPPTNSLVIYYPFDESQGATASDSTGNQNDGSVSGSFNWGAGLKGNALVMTGSPTTVNSSSPISVSNAVGFSAAAWVRLDTQPTNIRHIFRQNATSGTGRSWLYVNPNLVLTSFLGGASTTGGTLTLGQWHHVALTAGSGTMTLYLDGVEVGSRADTVESATGIVRMGQQANVASQFQWLGALDEARVYTRVLSDEEIGILAIPNARPSINAGDNQTGYAVLDNMLEGTLTYDVSAPAGVTTSWAQVSSAPNATISNVNDPLSVVTFPSAGNYTLRFTGSDGVVKVSNDVTWTITELSPAQSWRYQYFGAIENSGDGADSFDYDEDGLSNLYERAYGTEPDDATSYRSPSFSKVDASGDSEGGYFAFTYPRIAGGVLGVNNTYQVDGLTYQIENETELMSNRWDRTGLIYTGATSLGGDMEEASFRFETPMSDDAKRFFRLRVTSDED